LCADDGEDGEEEGDGHGDWQARRQREEHAVMDDTQVLCMVPRCRPSAATISKLTIPKPVTRNSPFYAMSMHGLKRHFIHQKQVYGIAIVLH